MLKYMICLNPILKSPLLAAIVAGCCVMLYFALMSYSPNLPPAVLCSIAIGYFVYFMMGGKVLCDEREPKQVYQGPVHSHPHTHKTENIPEAVATLPIENRRVRPAGKPVSAYKTF